MPRPRSLAPLFEPAEHSLVAVAARIAFANPFRRKQGDPPAPLPDVLTPILDRARERLLAGAHGSVSPKDRDLYNDACVFLLWVRHGNALAATIEQPPARIDGYGALARDHDRLLGPRVVGAGVEVPSPAHLVAILFQFRRAFHYLATYFVGASPPVTRLRAAVWQSIFTHDMHRYARSLHGRMDDFPTLVTGETGTGKELVARAIGLSRYVAFDPSSERFVSDHAADFHAVNLSALSPSLIESELFGHCRGAFTGAVADRPGRLEVCKPGGTIFLDELGELVPDIQVKLLRVLQTRRFERLGETLERPSSGRVVAATHRDLSAMVHTGAFRADLYYRLCAVQVRTPTLRDQLAAAPDERRTLVRHIAAKVAGPSEAEALADEVEAWIDARLPPDYAWPGNVRELEQCVRNVLACDSYRPIAPAAAPSPSSSEEDFSRDLREGKLTAEEALVLYTTIVHAQTGNLRETARRLAVDPRTAAARVDGALLARIKRGRGR